MGPSAVWNYFTKIKNGTKVKCNKCNGEFSFNGSTSSLANHLKAVHKIVVPKETPKAAKRMRLSSLEENEHLSQFSEMQQVIRFFL